MKIDRVDLVAAVPVGGYAWARYGWQLMPGDMEGLDQQIEERLKTLELKPGDRKVVEAILASKDPKKVWALSDLKTKVTRDGEETTLGKALLLGSGWFGTFRLLCSDWSVTLESPDDTAMHDELLARAQEQFPIESFLVMRRGGLEVGECLDALNYRETDLSFLHRAALHLDPDNEEELRALLGHSG